MLVKEVDRPINTITPLSDGAIVLALDSLAIFYDVSSHIPRKAASRLLLI